MAEEKKVKAKANAPEDGAPKTKHVVEGPTKGLKMLRANRSNDHTKNQMQTQCPHCGCMRYNTCGCNKGSQ